MKNLKAVLALLISASVFMVSCGPSQVVVRERPIEPVYVRPISPAAGYVWVEGGWIRRGGGYEYRPGYWAQPRYGRTYLPGYWVQSRKGYYYQPGRYN